MAESRELKPRRLSFMIPRIVMTAVVLVILSTMILVAAVVFEMLFLLALVPVLWVVLGGLGVVGTHVAYTKERYEIHADHLVAHTGSIASDARTELDIGNITHVRLRLPWLRHKLYGIGDVRVESAGSAASEITMQSVTEPEALYQEIQERMRSNGYSLQKSRVLHQESPGVLGAVSHVGQSAFGLLFGLGFVGFGLVGALADVLLDGDLAILLIPAFFLIVFGFFAMVLWLVLAFFDMKQRTYTVHEDAVVYTEGFLTRNNAVLPYENIADAAANRTFIDQIVGLYDVKVSCQGSGSEILFRRLAGGEALSQAIGQLVADASGKKAQIRKRRVEDPSGASDASNVPRRGRALPARQRVEPEEAWTAELRMNPLRAQLGLLPLVPALPAWLIAAVTVFFRASNTTFTVGPNSITSSYDFIGSNRLEFAYDKVTGVQISRNPFDELLGTVSIQIWSIGSAMPLDLTHVTEAEVDLPALLRQCGIDSEAPAQGELSQSFGPTVWAVQNAGTFVALLVATLVLLPLTLVLGPLALLPLLLILVSPLPMALLTRARVQRQRVTFHEQHVQLQTGILFRKHVYARYDNIKKVESTRIPLTEQGTLKLYIAGERVVQQQNGKQGGARIPYSLAARYIEDIQLKNDAVDALMLGLIEPSEITGSHPQDDDVLLEAKPAVANAVVFPAVIGLFFPPLLLLAAVSGVRAAMRRYLIERDRVVVREGILYKRSTSILVHKVDSLQQHQGLLGKTFGNGQVILLTAGSSAPDLIVANVPNYQEVYGIIRQNYGTVED